MSPARVVGSKCVSAFAIHRKTAQVKKLRPKSKAIRKGKKNYALGKRTVVPLDDGDAPKEIHELEESVQSFVESDFDDIQSEEDSSNATKIVLKSTKKGKSKKAKGKQRTRKLPLSKSQKKEKDFNGLSSSSSGDSIEEGRKLFGWLIEAVDPDEFFCNVWEKRPLHIKRNIPDYYKALLSTQMIDRILRSNFIQFSENIDVTSYRNGKRETHNPKGRAVPSAVWSFYSKGCSVRMLNPQTFSPKLGLLSATLQEYLGCFVGANSYLTPPDSQGFAPHYDDIEAFILQIEGKKNWKLYSPRSEDEFLPRFSSPNFEQDEIGEPILETTLCPGDLLYFPRGTIHQASTVPGHHSLHITLSCYQQNSWGDLLEKLIPAAITVAVEEDVDFRRGLPRDYLQHLGIVHSERVTPQRIAFLAQLQLLMGRLHQYLPVDAAVDQMGQQFLHNALPPILTAEERQCSVFDGGEKIGADGNIVASKELQLNTKIKLMRAHVLRVVKYDDSGDTIRVYHCVDNTLEYHAVEPQFFDISVDLAPGVEFLIHSYPRYIPVVSIPLDTVEMKMQIAMDLWKRGLLLTETPLAN